MFSTNFILTQGIKLLTWSEWDHCGLVIRNLQNKKLEMIEAIPDGVNIFPLNARLEYYHNCSKIGYLELTKFY